MINFEESGKSIVLSFELPSFHEEIYMRSPLLEMIEKELEKIDGVYKVNLVMNPWIECDFDTKEEIKTYIQTNIGKWINEEYQNKINLFHEEYSITGEGYLLDLIQELEKERFERINS